MFSKDQWFAEYENAINEFEFDGNRELFSDG